MPRSPTPPLLLAPLTALLLPMLACLSAGCPPPRAAFPWQPAGEAESRAPGARAVQTVGPAGYDRQQARLLVRRVERPTRANLDNAAYHANVMIRQPLLGEPIQPGAAKVPAGDELFGGVVERASIVASLAATPLSRGEQARPLAFSPLVDYLARWDAERAAGLERARAAVKSEAWGLRRRPGTYFQQITTLFLHGSGERPELWVEIELEPWARLFADMPDSDGDGYPEIFGRLEPSLASAELIARVREDYQGRELDTPQVHGWANELASYWYPSYNTDVVELKGARRWPLPDVEPAVVEASGGLEVAQPTVIIRGKPQGQAIYNVLVINGIAPMDGRGGSGGATTTAAAGLKAAPVTTDLEPLRRAIQAELAAHGGGWSAWAAQLAPTHRVIKAQLARRPAALKALVGSGGFLFYRRSLDYVVGGDIQAQPAAKNPLAAIVGFKDYLAKLGVDFLLVPVPAKPEVFPERVAGVKIKTPPVPVVNPHGRKFLLELNRAGVEVVDLLPLYLGERSKGRAGKRPPLYQPQDTHWTSRGLQLAAEALAARIQRYPWWSQLAAQPVAYTLEPTHFRRRGDLVSRLAPREQRRYKPARLAAAQVLTPEGKLYEDDASSPIVVLGDSFTGVYQRTDCGSAGLSAHLAHRLQHPVDLVMSYGGGPNVRNKLLRRSEDQLRQMRLVVWVFAARDFYNYWDDWAPLKQSGSKGKSATNSTSNKTRGASRADERSGP